MNSATAAWSSPEALLSAAGRVGLWFGCVVLSAVVLATVFSASGWLWIFRLALLFALPGACLYLPIVIWLSNADGKRLWILIGVGTLVGPPSIVLFGLIQQLRGVDPKSIWHNDPLVPASLIRIIHVVCPLVIGFLATAFYGLTLRFLNPAASALIDPEN